ncbi:MAG TPA: site-2 protease family protein, partial [Tepidisphaeraceae bacterium]|nr:site-2 protease family protein [Tepidisphaeraceae bacterium]
MSGFVEQAINIILLVFGFGFVIFFHELGHFLAAKWAGVKVEQFAVGFGSAMFSWRKGLGIRWGSSAKEYESILQAEREGIQKQDVSQISETEYRLNWVPLGGYVKMLGQDDLNPNATAVDPRAYNMKPIS